MSMHPSTNSTCIDTGILRDLSAEQQEHERMMAIAASAVDPIVEINARCLRSCSMANAPPAE